MTSVDIFDEYDQGDRKPHKPKGKGRRCADCAAKRLALKSLRKMQGKAKAAVMPMPKHKGIL